MAVVFRCINYFFYKTIIGGPIITILNCFVKLIIYGFTTHVLDTVSQILFEQMKDPRIAMFASHVLEEVSPSLSPNPFSSTPKSSNNYHHPYNTLESSWLVHSIAERSLSYKLASKCFWKFMCCYMCHKNDYPTLSLSFFCWK